MQAMLPLVAYWGCTGSLGPVCSPERASVRLEAGQSYLTCAEGRALTAFSGPVPAEKPTGTLVPATRETTIFLPVSPHPLHLPIPNNSSSIICLLSVHFSIPPLPPQSLPLITAKTSQLGQLLFLPSQFPSPFSVELSESPFKQDCVISHRT